MLRLRAQHAPRDPGEIERARGAEQVVGAERLADLLDLRVVVDWNELTVAIVDASDLPIGRRLQREAAREAFLRRRAAAPVERVVGMERRRWGGLVLDYSLFLPSAAPLGAGAYTATLGADAFGEIVQALAAGGDLKGGLVPVHCADFIMPWCVLVLLA